MLWFGADDKEGTLQAADLSFVVGNGYALAFTCGNDLAYHVDGVLTEVVPDVLWVMIEAVGHELDDAVFAPALGKGVAPDVGGFE